MTSTLMTPARSSNLLAKYFLWVSWNTLGYALALPAMDLSFWAWGSLFSVNIAWSPTTGTVMSVSTILLGIFQGVLISLIIASCQGVALGVRKIHILTWLLANILTWEIFLALAFNSTSVLVSFPNGREIMLRGIVMGLLIGIPQAFLIHRVNRGSWWWILASILGSLGGLALAVPIAMPIQRILSENTVSAHFLIVPSFGFVSSLISGLFLLRPIRWFDTGEAA